MVNPRADSVSSRVSDSLKNTILLIAFTVQIQPGQAKIHTLSDANLDVRFDDRTLTATVTDKRCGAVWEPLPLDENLTLKNIHEDENGLTVGLTGKADLEVEIALTPQSDLVYRISSKDAAAFEELRFPSAFKTPDGNHSVVYTDCEGYLLPADDARFGMGRNRIYTMYQGLTMAWIGMTDGNLEKGYMMILDTPDDAAFDFTRRDGLITMGPLWMASLGELGYTRTIIYDFFDKGGYVAQCKKYREYIWAKKRVVALKEQEKILPAIGKLIGAVHLYLWDDAREADFARELKDSGIRKAFILWDPSHLPYPEKGYDNRLKALGYLSGVYEQFRGVPPNSDHADRRRPNPIFLSRYSYPGLYSRIVLIQKDGSTMDTGFGSQVCPRAILSLIGSLRVDRELADYPHEAYFLDAMLAGGLFECFSPEHPLTRTQFREAALESNRIFMEKYGMVVGAEWGADCNLPYCQYNHGMLTLHRYFFDQPGFNTPGSVYYYGDWSDNARPSAMLETRSATEAYLDYSINERTRVPLFELVYHDAAVSTWRWDDTNHHMPEIWWKKDLFNILYGTPPLWSVDRRLWNRYKSTFVRGYQSIGPWLEQIGYDEMVSHRFVTPDRLVQETEFASGRKAVVNFGRSEYSDENRVVQPGGYILK